MESRGCHQAGDAGRSGEILSGHIEPIEGARIAWFGTTDRYDFLGEADVVDEMAGFWQPVDDRETRLDDPSARTEILIDS